MYECDLDIEKLPFGSKSFDCVLCTEVIEHMQNPYLLLREIRRVLKTNGRLILSTPNAASMNKIFEILNGDSTYGQSIIFWFEPREEYMTRERHVREYTLNELKYMLRKHNFKIQKIYFSDCGDMRLSQFKSYPGSNLIKFPAWLLGQVFRKIFPRFNSNIIIEAELKD